MSWDTILFDLDGTLTDSGDGIFNGLMYAAEKLGLPYREKGISIISIAVDAPQDVISTLSGKIGRLEGVSAKTAYSNVITKTDA